MAVLTWTSFPHFDDSEMKFFPEAEQEQIIFLSAGEEMIEVNAILHGLVLNLHRSSNIPQ
jgi:hypothetical protein